ncbi:MAG: carboxypeptidase regulatory-like domain-containing protein [Candidatus Sulfotelmatobacter sp.]|jgi:hypothetical protein
MCKLNLSIGMLCVVLSASLALRAQQAATAPVIIRVSDQSGARVEHAQIRFVPAPDPAARRLETDAQGQLSVNLKAGRYALFVFAQGFRIDTRHIDISIPEGQASAGQIVPVVLEVAHGGGVMVEAPAVEGSLMLSAADPNHAPVVLSPAEFRALPHITITVHNSHTNAAETYSGVPLATLLEKVNVPLGKELDGEAMTSYVVATGSDGYSVVLSLAEVNPEFHAGRVLVADARDGKALEKNGPFQLIVSDDKRPARWVHNLVSIAVRKAH